MIRRVLNLLVYGGSTKLRPYERALLTLAERVLSESNRRAFQDQVAKLQRIKRYNDDRMVTFQFDGVSTQCLADTSEELTLITYLDAARRKSKPLAVLISHRGRISSLELAIKPSTLDDSEWGRVTANLGGQDQQIAKAIDREEHDDKEG